MPSNNLRPQQLWHCLFQSLLMLLPLNKIVEISAVDKECVEKLRGAALPGPAMAENRSNPDPINGEDFDSPSAYDLLYSTSPTMSPISSPDALAIPVGISITHALFGTIG